MITFHILAEKYNPETEGIGQLLQQKKFSFILLFHPLTAEGLFYFVSILHCYSSIQLKVYLEITGSFFMPTGFIPELNVCLPLQVSGRKPVQHCAKGTVCLQVSTAGVSLFSFFALCLILQINIVHLCLFHSLSET